MAKNQLVGTWRLVSWELEDEKGQVSYPFGQDAVGFLTYTEDGHMSVVITTANRRRFAARDLLGGTVEERAAAAESCVAYCGTYQLHGNQVIIHVEASLFPNWMDTDQERVFDLDGERMMMSIAPSTWHDKQQRARLWWTLA